MIKKIDWYIIRKFLGTFFFTITLLLSIAVVFDVSEKLDDFLKEDAPFKAIVFDYYLNFVLFYGNLFSSMIVFIAAILFTSRMTDRTEVVAILTGGISFNRMLWPYFVAATLLAGGSFYLNNWVIPTTNQSRIDFTIKYIDGEKFIRYNDLHRQVRPGELIYFDSYRPDTKKGLNFTYEKIEDGALTYKLSALMITWSDEKEMWKVDNYTIRRFTKDGETLEKGRELFTEYPFTPDDLVIQKYTIETMNYGELNAFIEQEELRGSENINMYYIEKYKRLSWPVATYILTLIAISISTQKKRGGLGLNIAIGLLIVVSYIFFMQISTTFAVLGTMSPLLAVWIPNITFSILAIYLYLVAPK